jgi:hypothetical protein
VASLDEQDSDLERWLSLFPPAAVAQRPALPLEMTQYWFEIPALTLAEYLVHTASPENFQAVFTAVADGRQRAQQQHTRQIIQFQAVHALALHRAGQRRRERRWTRPCTWPRLWARCGPLSTEAR